MDAASQSQHRGECDRFGGKGSVVRVVAVLRSSPAGGGCSLICEVLRLAPWVGNCISVSFCESVLYRCCSFLSNAVLILFTFIPHSHSLHVHYSLSIPSQSHILLMGRYSKDKRVSFLLTVHDAGHLLPQSEGSGLQSPIGLQTASN